MKRLPALMLVLTALPCTSLHATTYSATSANYNFIQGSIYTTAMRISGTFTLDHALAPNLASYNLAATASNNTLLDWNFNDGAYTYTPANSTLVSTQFIVSTDASGNPTALGFGLLSPRTFSTAGQLVNDVGITTGDGVGADAGQVCTAVNAGQCTSLDASHASHSGVTPPTVTIAKLPDPSTVSAPAGSLPTWLALAVAMMGLAWRLSARRESASPA